MIFFTKWILAVLIYIFSVYVALTVLFQEDFLIFSTPLMLISALGITTSLSVNLMIHYKNKSPRFAKSYFFLSIAFASYTIAELIWALLDVAGLDPYPSLAEPFYVLYFVGSGLFCIAMFWCRRDIISASVKATALAASFLNFTFYFFLSLDNWGSETFLIDTGFMVLSSFLIGTATLAALAAWRAPKLRKVWILIGAALFFNSIADLFYYSDTQGFLYSDVSNIIWFGTTLLLFYALYLHRFLYIGNGR